MKKFRKIFNKYFLLFLFCIIIMLICSLYETNIFYIVRRFLFDSEYRANFSLAESTIKTNINVFQVIKQVITNYDGKFDYLLIFGTNLFQILLPCVVSIFGVLFYYKYSSIDQFAIYKTKNYDKYIRKQITHEALKTASTIFFSFIFFYIILFIITKGELSNYMGRTLFIDLLGNSFYNNNTYLYYILDGAIRMFLIPFVYTFFACSLAIILKTQKQVFLVSNIYYYGLSAIGFGLYYLIGDIALYFNPSVIMASGSYNNINTMLLICTNVIPLILGILIIRGKSKNVEI